MRLKTRHQSDDPMPEVVAYGYDREPDMILAASKFLHICFYAGGTALCEQCIHDFQ